MRKRGVEGKLYLNNGTLFSRNSLSMVFWQPLQAQSLAAQGFETIDCPFWVNIGYSKSPKPYIARLSGIFEPENCQPSTEDPLFLKDNFLRISR